MVGLGASEQLYPYLSNRNFELLLTQILCRRLNSGPGIVRVRVGLTYDPLRFIPPPTICLISPFPTFSAGVAKTLIKKKF